MESGYVVEFIDNQNVELKKLNSELDRFVYSASHELRAPLSSVLGLVDLAKRDKETPKEVYLDYIEQSVTKLDSIIHDIIDFSKNARLELEEERIDFDRIVKQVLDDVHFLEGRKQITIESSNHNTTPIYNDAKRLKLVLKNVVSNAIVHHDLDNQRNPFVKIHVVNHRRGVLIRVTDNGLGIEKRFLEDIFKMFFRGHAKSKGTGLGLYVTREVVTKLHGFIKVNSELGKGSEFQIYVPDIRRLRHSVVS